jgi:hypothetical protein
MPKNKGKRQDGTAATSVTDDFDKMLAEVIAADSVISADVNVGTATTADVASSSDSTSSGGTARSSPGFYVSEFEIVSACKRGDISQLRRWGRQLVRGNSVIRMPLIASI